MLSEEALQAFKTLYKEELNEELSDEKATEIAVNLLTMFNAIYRPIKKEWLKEPDYNANGGSIAIQ